MSLQGEPSRDQHINALELTHGRWHLAAQLSTEIYPLFSAVIESFKDYVAVETMEGDNKYDAGEHGLQVLHVVRTHTRARTHTHTHTLASYSGALLSGA